MRLTPKKFAATFTLATVLLAACADIATAPAATDAALVGATALAKESGCKGLDNARTKGADPRAHVVCDWDPQPVTISVTSLVIPAGDLAPRTITITNPNPATADFYSGGYGNQIAVNFGSCVSIPANSSCELTIARAPGEYENAAFTAAWSATYGVTLHDGSVQTYFVRVEVTGEGS
jgi:hypothetical protein